MSTSHRHSDNLRFSPLPPPPPPRLAPPLGIAEGSPLPTSHFGAISAERISRPYLYHFLIYELGFVVMLSSFALRSVSRTRKSFLDLASRGFASGEQYVSPRDASLTSCILSECRGSYPSPSGYWMGNTPSHDSPTRIPLSTAPHPPLSNPLPL